MSRDIRLLVLVVVVSGLTLAVLARFRFPGEQRAVNPSPAPLERLAARATYDELASIVAQLQTRIASSMVVLRMVRTPTTDERSLAGMLDAPGAPRSVRLALGIRVRPDQILAHVEPSERPEGLVGAGATPSMIAYDPLRLVALLTVPPATEPGSDAVWRDVQPPSSPRYVAVAEATQGGPALRPLFIGRTDPFADRRWNTSLLALGGAGVTQAGSFVFSLDGALEGLVIVEQALPVLAPTSALIAAVDDLEHGRVAGGGDLGIEYTDLTPAVADATGTDHGAVITYVRSTGPAADALDVGDVVVAVNGAAVESSEELTLRIARSAPGTSVNIDVVRRGTPATIPLVLGTPHAAAIPADGQPNDIGLILREADQAGAEVLKVRAGSPAAAAGVAAGDLITDIDGASAPTPSVISRAFRGAQSGRYVLLAITRRSEHLVIAVRKP